MAVYIFSKPLFGPFPTFLIWLFFFLLLSALCILDIIKCMTHEDSLPLCKLCLYSVDLFFCHEVVFTCNIGSFVFAYEQQLTLYLFLRQMCLHLLHLPDVRMNVPGDLSYPKAIPSPWSLRTPPHCSDFLYKTYIIANNLFLLLCCKVKIGGAWWVLMLCSQLLTQ